MAVSLTELAKVPATVTQRATVPPFQDAENSELLCDMLSQAESLVPLVDKAVENGQPTAEPGPYGNYQILSFAKK